MNVKLQPIKCLEERSHSPFYIREIEIKDEKDFYFKENSDVLIITRIITHLTSAWLVVKAANSGAIRLTDEVPFSICDEIRQVTSSLWVEHEIKLIIKKFSSYYYESIYIYKTKKNTNEICIIMIRHANIDKVQFIYIR